MDGLRRFALPYVERTRAFDRLINPTRTTEAFYRPPSVGDAEQKNVLSTFINNNNCNALLHREISDNYHELAKLPFFTEMIVTAIYYECTLCICPSPPGTVEHYLTHLVRKRTGNLYGCTLNGHYVVVGETIKVFAPTFVTATFPWKMAVGLFRDFPDNFDLNLPPGMRGDVDGGIQLPVVDELEITKTGVIITPIGDVPVMYIPRSFNVFGSSWQCEFDTLDGPCWGETCAFAGDYTRRDARNYAALEYWGRYAPYTDEALCFLREFSQSEHFADVAAYIEVVVSEFPKMVEGADLATKGEKFRRVVNGILRRMEEHTPQPKGQAVRIAIEATLAHRLFDLLWPPLIEARTGTPEPACDVDRELEARILALQFLRAKDFDVPALDTPKGRNGLYLVIQELRKTNSYKAPHQKALMLINALRLLEAVLVQVLPENTTISADILFPSFVYVLIAGNIPHLNATILYINAFMNIPFYQLSYFVTTTESAISLIMSLQPMNVEWDEHDFVEMLNVSKCHCSPFDFTSLVVLKCLREHQIFAFEQLRSVNDVSGVYREMLLDAYRLVRDENEALRKALRAM